MKRRKGFIRVIGSTGRQTGPALLRWLLVCVVLAVASAQSHHAFASEIGHDTISSASVDMVTSGPDHHSDGPCQSMGHCAPVFVGIAPAFSLAAIAWAAAVFVPADALPLHGCTVDPGQHPPKIVQLL